MQAPTKSQFKKEPVIDPIALKRLADFLIILFEIDQKGTKTMGRDA
jgi:hypothetical protein